MNNSSSNLNGPLDAYSSMGNMRNHRSRVSQGPGKANRDEIFRALSPNAHPKEVGQSMLVPSFGDPKHTVGA